ncbi:hypothetical protein N7457_001705 [Penicillium paradoxum]|uniref:uncharacterized protein n=1 Tax=Penicillium paradoxum TaxID=176176 RepID=UPI002549AFD5|nr:uncharacterized protein N7457_001705 [Penicillium paradoxum]KAJ5795106.1 hypothetical protein N7457_001705 [Penicillium paradoxum]
MHVNKRIGRFKQWAGERMGGEAKTCLSDDFKAMETEMGVRQEGVDRIHKSMTSYVKALSKRNEGDDKEKTLPIAHLGGSMVAHGEDYDGHSEYGQCLIMFGRTEERIARIQESYIAQATSSWLESLERSLTQMKDLQHARKKLDSRRLAYDTSLSKMEKAKREDFRVEEELRSQKVKYEEASDDVLRRMQDIKEAETDNVMDMQAFLDAQLEYHERSREALLQLKNEWAGPSQAQAPPRRPIRPRSNTAHSYQERYEPLQEELMNATETRPSIRSTRTLTPYESPPKDSYVNTNGVSRPVLNRVPTFEGPAQLRQEQAPVASQWIQQRTASENMGAFGRRSSTQVGSGRISADPYADSEEVSSYGRSSPERMFGGGRSISPATSHGSVPSRRPSTNNLNSLGSKKAPPPPPPSRAKKPPPPPPVKRSLLAAPNALLSVLCSEHPDFPEPVAQLRPLPISIFIHPLFERAIPTRFHLWSSLPTLFYPGNSPFYSLSLTPLSLKVPALHIASPEAPTTGPNITLSIAKHPIPSPTGRIHGKQAHPYGRRPSISTATALSLAGATSQLRTKWRP